MARSAGFRIPLLAALLGLAAGFAPAQEPPPGFGVTDSAAGAFRTAVAGLTSPEFEQRKARRLELQRRGYASILHRSCARDVWGAILALLKTKAQLDYHLPSNTLMATVWMQPPPEVRRGPGSLAPPAAPRYQQYPLIEDRWFPKDPWRK
jgi:hypothetical protein